LRNPCKAIVDVAIAIIVSITLVKLSLLRTDFVVSTELSTDVLRISHTKKNTISAPPTINAIDILSISLPRKNLI